VTQVQRTTNEVSCLNCKAIFDYVNRYKPDRINELFLDLPSPYNAMEDIVSFLIDENNWVSSDLIVKLFENARKILGDKEVAFRIGFESIVNKKLGHAQKLFIAAFSSPLNAIERINHLNSQFNRTKIVEAVYITPGRAVIKIHWKEGRVLSKDLCLYNKGVYSAIPTIWNLPPAEVEETECFFRGDNYCRYVITWRVRNRLKNFIDKFFVRKSSLVSALMEIERDKQVIKNKYQEIYELNVALYEKIERLKAINSASNFLVTERDLNSLFDYIMRIVIKVLKFDRAILMLVNAERGRLEYAHAVGARSEDIEKLRGYFVPLSRDNNILIRVIKEAKPVLVRDVKESGLNPRNFILSEFKPTSFAICPLIARDRVIGVLGADRRAPGVMIEENDLDLLSVFANNIAVAIQRSMLDSELKSSYLSAVFALVRAIENKDPCTKGHSERVSVIAELLGRRMGFSQEEVEFLRIGGILHDVGKIGIPESIVRSPKPLTKSEYKIIMSHPIRGVEILEPISFMRNHLYLIRNHHERFDGKGYPDGLKGDNIPMGAQIIAIADTFDAMISSRPYRKGLPLKQAAREIYKNAGTQFSVEVVNVFREIFEDGSLLSKLQNI